MKHVLIIAVLLLMFATPAYAHPGRTDSQGGHYDRSTGTYHFHSGEYAGKNQSSSSGSSSSILLPDVTLEPYPSARPSPTNNNVNAVSDDKSLQPFSFSSVGTPTKWALGLGAAVVLSLGALCSAMKTQDRLLGDINALKEKNKELEKELADRSMRYQALKAENQKLCGNAQDIRDLMATLSVIEHERDEEINKTSILRSQLDSYSVINRSLTDRNRALQSILTPEQQRKLIRCGHTAAPEAFIYVCNEKSHKFHITLHGDWVNHRLIPLSKALDDGFMPCLICAKHYKLLFRCQDKASASTHNKLFEDPSENDSLTVPRL